MQCLACGAEMQLREVVLADIPTMPGFERHTFRCSACAQVARRLVICRAKMLVVDPLVPPSAPEASASKLQSGRPAAGNPSPTVVEKLRSRQMALKERAATGTSPLRTASSPAAQPAVRGEGRAGGTFRDRICNPKSPEDP